MGPSQSARSSTSSPAKTPPKPAEKPAVAKKKETKLEKFKDILAIPFGAFTGMFDDILLKTLLPGIVRYVSHKTDWKKDIYWTGYKLGLKLDQELDRLLKGRGNMVEDPLQGFLNELHQGIQDGADKDEGKAPKYPVPTA